MNQVLIPWHQVAEHEVLRRLETTYDGLTNERVKERQRIFGPNRLRLKEPPTLLTIFVHQFLSPLIYILLVAGVISLFIGDRTDAAFIFAILLLNASLGTFQEWKAERSAAALQSLLQIHARVRREGIEQDVPAEDLVPGDICLLVSGNRVPADLRLIGVKNLSIDESLLTGESLAVAKAISLVSHGEASISDRLNMAYGGTTVMVGRAVGVVVETGLQTEVAKIAKTVTETEEAKPPLVVRMDEFARYISIAVVGACGLLAIVAITKGISWIHVFFMAVALAVSAIPEGLPVAMTVALSVATSRMAKRHVIVRKLTAVEGLGSCTIIASDKTGTLTVNQQTVKRIVLPRRQYFSASGEGYTGEGELAPLRDEDDLDGAYEQITRLGIVGVLCNEGQLECQRGTWVHHGDAVDIALLALGYKLNLDPPHLRKEYQILETIPFESERQFAAVVYRDVDGIHVAVKGAMEKVLHQSQRMLVNGEEVALDKAELEHEAVQLAQQGYRVLALADTKLDTHLDDGLVDEQDLPPLTFLGLVGTIDPLRKEVKDAVGRCKQAGVQVAMITGDHPATALAIARELDIATSEEEVMTGRQLMEMGSAQVPLFLDTVKHGRVFARVTPIQKHQIVEALVRLGHFVAVTGDGVNDAPALRKAHLGVAMGSGTDVAKDSSAMIITDDRFASIVAGVEEGRYAYDNIRKVVALLISCGAAEIFLFTAALFAGLPLPLTAVQLLWLNLVTNGPQDVALAFEAGEPGAMTRPPRKPTEGIFDTLMIQQTLVSGLVIGTLASAAWFWWLHMGWPEAEARNLLLLLMVFLENVHVFNCRSEHRSAFRVALKNNWILLVGVLVAQGIHIVSMYVPVTQHVLKVNSVSFWEWISLLLLACVILLAMEIFKVIKSPRVPQPAAG